MLPALFGKMGMPLIDVPMDTPVTNQQGVDPAAFYQALLAIINVALPDATPASLPSSFELGSKSEAGLAVTTKFPAASVSFTDYELTSDPKFDNPNDSASNFSAVMPPKVKTVAFPISLDDESTALFPALLASKSPVTTPTELSPKGVTEVERKSTALPSLGVGKAQFLADRPSSPDLANSDVPVQGDFVALVQENSYEAKPVTEPLTSVLSYRSDVPGPTVEMLKSGLNLLPVLPAQTQTMMHPPSYSAWAREFSEKVVWMVRDNLQMAQIKLNPENLGQLEIRLTINNDQASVWFTAPIAQAREAIESAIPQLRDMLSSQGIQLGQASVSSGRDGEHRLIYGDKLRPDYGDANQEDSRAITIRLHRGLFDDYA